jgi:cyclopropane-fatty-acyl-phospholipid synthase
VRLATVGDRPVDILLSDYRTLDERFDRIFSFGMFEHVGTKNYREIFPGRATLPRRHRVVLAAHLGRTYVGGGLSPGSPSVYSSLTTN